MQAAAAPAAAPPPRRRVYTAVEPRCEWARTEDADTLIVHVSGFRKEELKVLYNTSGKLTVTGERRVDGARWARFRKVFPVPRSCDAGAIRATMYKEDALLSVTLPKGASSSSSMNKQKEQQPGSSQPDGEQKGGAGSADGSSGSTGSLWSAREDAGKDRFGERKTELEKNKEKRREEIATQDVPRTDWGGDANAVKKEDAEKGRIGGRKTEPEETKEKRQEEIATQDAPRTDSGGDADAVKKEDGDGKSARWWAKIRPLHALGFVLVLALLCVGACVLYVMLL